MTSKPEISPESSPESSVESSEESDAVGHDESLLNAHDLALAALADITPASTVGPPAGYILEVDGIVSLRFASRLIGYPGWFWTVSIANVGDDEPTVLEAELLPGDGALVAPDWVPWAVRLADYQAAQIALAEAAGEDTLVEGAESDEDDDDLDDDDDELDDVDDLDAADFDDDGSPILHSGDVDGVDIDALDPDDPDAVSDEDDDDSDDEDSDD